MCEAVNLYNLRRAAFSGAYHGYMRTVEPIEELAQFRERFLAYVRRRVADAELAEDGLPAQDFLKARNPAWNLVGRVHFNLAENRKDEAAPFALGGGPTCRSSTIRNITPLAAMSLSVETATPPLSNSSHCTSVSIGR